MNTNFKFHISTYMPNFYSKYGLSSLVVHLHHGVSRKSWIKMNAGQTGFYRVNYEIENWNKLIHQLNTHHQVNLINWNVPVYVIFSVAVLLQRFKLVTYQVETLSALIIPTCIVRLLTVSI